MGSRLTLHNQLLTIADHVYFQPPESLKLVYPCIVYSLSDVQEKHADDTTYKMSRGYDVKYISSDPDNTVIDQLIAWPHCRFERRVTADNLYNDCFKLYF